MTTPVVTYGTESEFEEWLRRPTSLTDAELDWVRNGLQVAAILIRNNVDMTDAVEGDDKWVIARLVSFMLVQSAFTQAWDRANMKSWSQGMGPFVESATVHNPDAVLGFTEAHRAMFPGMRAATAPKWRFGC